MLLLSGLVHFLLLARPCHGLLSALRRRPPSPSDAPLPYVHLRTAGREITRASLTVSVFGQRHQACRSILTTHCVSVLIVLEALLPEIIMFPETICLDRIQHPTRMASTLNTAAAHFFWAFIIIISPVLQADPAQENQCSIDPNSSFAAHPLLFKDGSSSGIPRE